MSTQDDRLLREMMAETERAERQRERLRLRAIDTVFPADIPGWLDSMEHKRLPQELKELPEDIRQEFQGLLGQQLKLAKLAFNRGDEPALHEAILTIMDNLSRTTANRVIHSAKRSKTAGKVGGQADKRRVWAELMADKVCGIGKNKTIWQHMENNMNSHDPETVENVDVEYEVYVDGEELIGVNTLTKHMQAIKKETFFSEYVREARKRRK
ncbi:MAG: hypothetical protein WAV92_05755 [Halopseudomonas yangmingensis]